ncbi:MAG: transporter [Blastococcus sp.]|jgi:EmrB/QacA subfamily drug resistance transporter|nr:transporter [Blastococcus sp.]
MTNAALADGADARRWRALSVSLVAAFMVLLDVSIVNVALPSIEREFGVSAGTIQWVVSGYALTFGLALVPAGRLGDTVGRRRMFLIALSAFVLTSALTGAAQNSAWLIGARLLQGMAAGMLIPQNVGLIQDLFRGGERARAFGVLGSIVGLSTATGPVVGGLILSVVGGADAWRWIFYVNVPIGVVALVLAVRLVPATSTAGARGTHLDLVGSLLLGGGVLGLLLPVVATESGSSSFLWLLVVPAVLLLAAFGWWEARTARRGRAPLLDPGLARTAGFPTGSAVALVYFTGFTGIWVVLALFFQDGLGYSPLRSGLAVTPFALGSAASAVFAGRMVPRFGRWLTVSGLLAAAVGMVATALILRRFGGDTAAWAAAGPLLVAGIGGGMVVSPNTTLTLESVPGRMAGAAGGALQTAQRIGSALGTALLATVYYHALTSSRGGFGAAVSDALLAAAGLMLLALLIAVGELNRRRHHPPSSASSVGTGTTAGLASPRTVSPESVTS